LSEALTSAIKKANMRRHIDEIQKEVARLRTQSGLSREGDVNLLTEKLQGVLRNECAMLAKEIGLGGDYPLTFMLTNALVCLAWSSFSIKKTSLDQSRPFEETFEMVALTSGFGEVLNSVAADAAAYAELSNK
jgi:hypothetical protein